MKTETTFHTRSTLRHIRRGAMSRFEQSRETFALACCPTGEVSAPRQREERRSAWQIFVEARELFGGLRLPRWGRHSGQNSADKFAVNIRQTVTAALEFVGQALVVDAQQV